MVVSSFELDKDGNPVEVLRDLEDLKLFGRLPEYNAEELKETKYSKEKGDEKKC